MNSIFSSTKIVHAKIVPNEHQSKMISTKQRAKVFQCSNLFTYLHALANQLSVTLIRIPTESFHRQTKLLEHGATPVCKEGRESPTSGLLEFQLYFISARADLSHGSIFLRLIKFPGTKRSMNHESTFLIQFHRDPLSLSTVHLNHH